MKGNTIQKRGRICQKDMKDPCPGTQAGSVGTRHLFNNGYTTQFVSLHLLQGVIYSLCIFGIFFFF